MASFDEETANKLLTQVEFYFSDSNLPRDVFLNREVSKSKDGLVSLPLVCSFSRMRNLLGLGNLKREDIPDRIVQGVANLLRASLFLKVSDNGQRIGRGTRLSKPQEVLEQVHRRTVAASPFEYTTKMEDVASFFSQYAKVNSIRLPHHIRDKRHFSGTALVEFSSQQDTEYILGQRFVYAGADLVLIPKSDFDCQREHMINQLGISHNEFPRGQLVKFTLKRISTGENVTNKEKNRTLENKIGEKENKEAGIAERLEGNDRNKKSGESLCARLCKERVHNADQLVVPQWNNNDSVGSEVLKDVFQRFGSIKHIEHAGGLDSGFICFIDSETAMKARTAVEFVGGLIVKSIFLVTLEAVNGEMEREVWKRLSSAKPEGERKEEDNKKEKKQGRVI